MKGKRFTIPRSSKYARHLWGRAGTFLKETPSKMYDYASNRIKDSKEYWLKFDEPLPAKDEFGHDSRLAGWEGVWISQELITEAEGY